MTPERRLLRLRHTVGEISTADLVLAGLFCLWADAVDRVAAERAFSTLEISDWCARPVAECRLVLRALCVEECVVESQGTYRLSSGGFAALDGIVDVTRVLATGD